MDEIAARTDRLAAAVERLADRYRSMPESRLRRFAAEGLAVARALASVAGELEAASGARVPGAGHRVPDAGWFVVGDQVAVAGHDLVAILRERAAERAGGGAGGTGGADNAGEGAGGGDGRADLAVAETELARVRELLARC